MLEEAREIVRNTEIVDKRYYFRTGPPPSSFQFLVPSQAKMITQIYQCYGSYISKNEVMQIIERVMKEKGSELNEYILKSLPGLKLFFDRSLNKTFTAMTHSLGNDLIDEFELNGAVSKTKLESIIRRAFAEL